MAAAVAGVRVIFLDIDGVICCNLTNRLEKPKMKILQRIVGATDAKVVLSTGWRLVPSLKERLLNTLEKYGIQCLGTTPCHGANAPVRPREIMAWLKGYEERDSSSSPTPIAAWAVVDDRSLLAEHGGSHLNGHFVQTDFMEGLTDDVANRLIAILTSASPSSAAANGFGEDGSPGDCGAGASLDEQQLLGIVYHSLIAKGLVRTAVVLEKEAAMPILPEPVTARPVAQGTHGLPSTPLATPGTPHAFVASAADGPLRRAPPPARASARRGVRTVDAVAALARSGALDALPSLGIREKARLHLAARKGRSDVGVGDALLSHLRTWLEGPGILELGQCPNSQRMLATIAAAVPGLAAPRRCCLRVAVRLLSPANSDVPSQGLSNGTKQHAAAASAASPPRNVVVTRLKELTEITHPGVSVVVAPAGDEGSPRKRRRTENGGGTADGSGEDASAELLVSSYSRRRARAAKSFLLGYLTGWSDSAGHMADMLRP